MSSTTLLPPATAIRMVWAQTGRFSDLPFASMSISIFLKRKSRLRSGRPVKPAASILSNIVPIGGVKVILKNLGCCERKNNSPL